MYAFAPQGIPNATLYERTVEDKDDGKIEIEVPQEEIEQVAPVKRKVGVIEELRESSKNKDVIKLFPQNIVDWFLVDQEMEPSDKRDLILQRQEPVPPYAEGLLIEGLNYIVFGPNDIVNDKNEKVELIGKELDSFKAWANTHLDKIVKKMKEGKIMCTIEKQTLKIVQVFREQIEAHMARKPRSQKASNV